MNCAICQTEPMTGWITVTRERRGVDGTFRIGKGCYRLHIDALEEATSLSDFAKACAFRPDGDAAKAWLRALLHEMRPIVSRRVQWK